MCSRTANSWSLAKHTLRHLFQEKNIGNSCVTVGVCAGTTQSWKRNSYTDCPARNMVTMGWVECLLLLVTLVGLTSSLKCFLCKYKGNTCPTAGDPPSGWSSNTAKYDDVGLDKNYFCVVSTTKAGDVVYQVRPILHPSL